MPKAVKTNIAFIKFLNLFYLKLKKNYVFKLFWYADIKNNFFLF